MFSVRILKIILTMQLIFALLSTDLTAFLFPVTLIANNNNKKQRLELFAWS